MTLILNVLVLSLFSVATTFAEALTSGCDLITREGKCFSYFFQSTLNWFEARAKCQTWGGHLASIDSANEDVALHYIENPGFRYSCWIGLNDMETDGTFVWLDGSNSSYRNWAPNEPNNDRGANEECGENNWTGDLKWNDQLCTSRRQCYFCSSRDVSLFGRMQNANTLVDELSNNTILSENTTLYCITENKNTPQVDWSYGRGGSRAVLSSTTDVTTGVSLLTVTADKPGYYSCEVTRDNGVSRIYSVLMPGPFLTVPQITFPNMNITRILIGTGVAIGSVECIATGVPLPNIYWTRDFMSKFIDSPILQVNIQDLANDGDKIFYCVAESVAGRNVASVTYELKLTIETIQENLEEISDELNGIVDSISDERAGQIADLSKVVVDAANNDADINSENRSMVLVSAAMVVELIINKTSGAFSSGTAGKITGLLSSIVNGSSYLQESEPLNVEQQQAEQPISTISTALAITLNTLERFSQRLIEDLGNREVNTVRTVESQLITIVVQNVALSSSGDGNDTKAEIVLPKNSSDAVQYSVMVEFSTNLAFNLSTDGKSLAIATAIIQRIEGKNSDSNDGKFGSRQSTQGSDILTIALEGKSGIVELTENNLNRSLNPLKLQKKI